ncbi:MAG: hypothetical protein JWO36_3573 [Myxococcales bacterium]|nr:hypothetical protein [Myxococcales bacterium]
MRVRLLWCKWVLCLRIALVLSEPLLRLRITGLRTVARLLRLLTVCRLLRLLPVGRLLRLLAVCRLLRLLAVCRLLGLTSERLAGLLSVSRLLGLSETRTLLSKARLLWLSELLTGLLSRLTVSGLLRLRAVGRRLSGLLSELLTGLLSVSRLLAGLRRVSRLLRRLAVLRLRLLRWLVAALLRRRRTWRLLRWRKPLLLRRLKSLLWWTRRLAGCTTRGDLCRRRSRVAEHRLRRLLTARRRSRLHRRHRSSARTAGGCIHQRRRTAVGARPSWSCHSGIPCSFELNGIAEQEVKATNRHGFGRTDRRDIATDPWPAAFPQTRPSEVRRSRSVSRTPRCARIPAKASPLPRSRAACG